MNDKEHTRVELQEQFDELEATVYVIKCELKEQHDRLRGLHQDMVEQYEVDRIERDVFVLKMVVYGLPMVYLFFLLVCAAYRIGY